MQAKKGDEDTDEKREKRRSKREKFLQSCVELGLEYEIQDCRVCIKCMYMYSNHVHVHVHVSVLMRSWRSDGYF